MNPALSKVRTGYRNRCVAAQRGVSLIEVLIALVVFALGVVGMAGLQLGTLRLTMDSSQRSYVISKTQDIADRIRSNGIAPSEYLGGPAYDADFCEANEDVLKSCSDEAAHTVEDATACTGAEMSAFDFYDAFCVGEGSLDEQVADWSVGITCAFPDPAAAGVMVPTTACDEEGATISITTTWFARTAIDGGNGEEADSMTLRFVP